VTLERREVRGEAHQRIDDARDPAFDAEIEETGPGEAAGAGGELDHPRLA
jgi:hypothetical protein